MTPLGVDTPNTQAPVIEAHPSASDALRGIVVAGGEFGVAPTIQRTSRFSNRNPGRYGRDYHFDTARTFGYLASRGVAVVKIPFRWERLQPRLGRRLDRKDLGRLREAVTRAGEAGLRVILDAHNFGAYSIATAGGCDARSAGPTARSATSPTCGGAWPRPSGTTPPSWGTRP